MEPVTIKVIYFKPSGKYYGEGYFKTHLDNMYELFDSFEYMLSQGRRPGLIDGYSGYTAVLDCSEHPNGYPAMFPGKA